LPVFQLTPVHEFALPSSAAYSPLFPHLSATLRAYMHDEDEGVLPSNEKANQKWWLLRACEGSSCFRVN